MHKGAENMKAVVLLSGGLDSTVCMAVAKDRGFEIFPISFNYHQRHKREIESAKNVAAYYKVKKHLIIETNFNDIGGSALTDSSIDVPRGDVQRHDIPITYVPARNLIFLSYAVGYAEVIGAKHIFIGVNSLDYSGYPDCRPEFIDKFQAVANLATKVGVEEAEKLVIETPLLNLSKKEIVLLGTKLKAPIEFTTSCYNGADAACGKCDSCLLRLKGFKEAGLKDPIPYVKE